MIIVPGLCLLCFVWQGNRLYKGKYFVQTNSLVTLGFHYMQYGCGCYPQWNADSVISGDNADKFIGKDMEVLYKNDELDRQLGEGDSLWNCYICSDFYITGTIRKTLSGKYRMIADRYSFIADTTCCNKYRHEESNL